MEKYLLVVNTGSSSIKFTVYIVDSVSEVVETVNGQIDGIGWAPKFNVTCASGDVLVENVLENPKTSDHKACLNVICSWLFDYVGEGNVLAVGHRVVHGGVAYTTPVFLTEKIVGDLECLIPLAPLHQPHNLLAIRVFQEMMPDLPQVACFDTAFHAAQPEVAQRFGLPRRFYNEGIRRYGFHGLSYEYMVSVLPDYIENFAHARVIFAHLGNGCSLCAIRDGVSIATTMGFSPLDGLLMGTRCGSLDPGVMLYLMEHDGMDARALEQLLYHESGLLGVSGLSSDMRTLLASDEMHAKETIDLFAYRIKRELGSLTAAMEGLDALIFTGGIGEHSAEIRATVCNGLKWLGLELDDSANKASSKHISAINSKIDVWVLKTNENLMIAKHTQKIVSQLG